MTVTHVQVCPYVVGWMMFKVEPAANTNIVFQESDPVHQRGPGPSNQTSLPRTPRFTQVQQTFIAVQINVCRGDVNAQALALHV